MSSWADTKEFDPIREKAKSMRQAADVADHIRAAIYRAINEYNNDLQQDSSTVSSIAVTVISRPVTGKSKGTVESIDSLTFTVKL